MFAAPAYVAANADDHQYIEVIGNSVSAMISGRGDDKGQLIKLLETLKRSLKLHFVIEENMMADLGYEGLSDHRSSHLLIISEVSDCLQSIAKDDEERNTGLWPHVKVMLRHHMQRFDRDLAEYIDRRAALDRLGPAPVVLTPLLGGVSPGQVP